MQVTLGAKIFVKVPEKATNIIRHGENMDALITRACG
jgi:hypothetical protein